VWALVRFLECRDSSQRSPLIAWRPLTSSWRHSSLRTSSTALLRCLDEMKAIDDEADIRQVVPDCVDIGIAHIATGPTNAFSLFGAERFLKEAIDRLPAFTFAHPQDAGTIQVVDDRGELPAFAVRDLIDSYRGQAAYSVPVARPVDDPVQQVRQR